MMGEGGVGGEKFCMARNKEQDGGGFMFRIPGCSQIDCFQAAQTLHECQVHEKTFLKVYLYFRSMAQRLTGCRPRGTGQ